MKIKSAVTLLVFMGTGYIIATQWDNISQQDLLSDTLEQISGQLSDSREDSEEPDEVIVHRYQDKDGGWHFSNTERGENGTGNTNLGDESYDLNRNVIPAVKPTAPSQNNSSTPATKPTSDPDAPTASPLTIYSDPKKVMKLIQDAKSLQQKLDDRQTQMDRRIDQN